MRIILPLLFLLCSISVSAQKIHFTDSSNVWEWRMLTENQQTPGYHYTFTVNGYGPDSTVNGVLYKTLVIPGPDFIVAFIREDTVAGKIFIKFPEYGCPNSPELVLYNYNWQVGDTINYAPCGPERIITQLDSIIINNTWHRVWKAEEYIIEGIGGTNGPLFYARGYWDPRDLICFYNNDITPRIQPKIGIFDNDTSCLLRLKIKELESRYAQPTLYPNPATPDTKLSLPYPMQSATCSIYNTYGQRTASISATNTSTIPIGQYLTVPGYYCYTITDQATGKTFTGKFVYTNP